MVGDVLLLRMSGPLTAQVLDGFAADAMAKHAHEAKGFILDYRPGLLVATADQLGEMLERMPAESPMRRPGAFVGSPGSLKTLQLHARHMGRAGIWRRVFVDTMTAHDWILERLRG